MKDVSTQQVAEHLKRLNPWWTSGQMDEGTLVLRPRAYLPLVRQILLDEKLRRAVVLLPPLGRLLGSPQPGTVAGSQRTVQTRCVRKPVRGQFLQAPHDDAFQIGRNRRIDLRRRRRAARTARFRCSMRAGGCCRCNRSCRS